MGSRHSPATTFIAWNGETSGGAPSSSKKTDGTRTPSAPSSARIRRAWRATSRLRTGSRPGGATFSTTVSTPEGPFVTWAVNVRLDAPPVSGTTPSIVQPGAQF